MKKWIGIGLAVLVVLGVGAYLLRVPLYFMAMRFMGPSHGFDPARKAAPPDYATTQAWIALPETRDLADYVPAGVESSGLPDVAASPGGGSEERLDAFFVHPTTYLRDEDWNDPLRSGTATEENTRWVLANQASAYSGCCRVHAPRYRQSSIYSFFAGDTPVAERALDLAYRDVERAFDTFLDRIGDGAPFLLASHSQGTMHLRRLLRERISGTPLVQRMVSAYLIGGGVTPEELDALPDLSACQSATDLHCVIHWATYGPDGRSFEPTPALCTNPLTWKTDEVPAPASANLGAVVPSGSFDTQVRGEDRARGISFEPLPAPLPGHTGAQCKEGRLVVDPQEDSPFAAYTTLGGQNYHGLDYALFYMNIRQNAIERARAYLAASQRSE